MPSRMVVTRSRREKKSSSHREPGVVTLGVSTPIPRTRRTSVERQYVGIDLHRRRSVIVRMTGDGEVLETVRIDNDPVALSLELAKAGPDPEVALEACYGWDWAADVLVAEGANVTLVQPSGLPWGNRRVKKGERVGTELGQRVRTGR